MTTPYLSTRLVLGVVLVTGAALLTACNSSTSEDPIQPPPPVLDSDGDGVNDSDDICPGTPAGVAVAANGCALPPQDTDQDGVTDVSDQCPSTPRAEAADETGCSISQRDSDNDTVADSDDQCPDTPATETANAQGCGPSQLDSDNDGFANGIDACPNSAPDAYVPLNGCPITGEELVPGTQTRYAMNNQCFALRSAVTGRYVAKNGGAFAADAQQLADATGFYFKPTALGKYLLHDPDRQLLTRTTTPPNAGSLTAVTIANASDASEWTVLGVADAAVYPPTPEYDVEPTPQQVIDYFDFVDPNSEHGAFNLFASDDETMALAADSNGAVAMSSAGSAPQAQAFQIEPAANCAAMTEATSNVAGEFATGMEPSFSGTTEDGRVLGMADVHVHVSATTFLGLTEWGSPIHKFGVEHALADCTAYHGPQGERDTVGAGFSGDMDGHNVAGWPTFPEWPARGMLTHEAIYWKWLERAWQSGLRLIVNDVVENATLCELQRQTAPPDEAAQIECNEMNSAGNQVGSMMYMQDYIDAQYGGRGEGFFQIVHTPEDARAEIVRGNAAVVLGIEVSNLLNCQITYNNPLRLQEPFEETGDPLDGGVTYGCAMTETGAPNEIATQLQRLWDLGIRQIISIHEFDNAFGGNGIFDGQILNLGNRENSGGAPTADPNDPFSNQDRAETPSGEFWTTYDCPEEGGLDNDGTPFSGYLWGDSGGSSQSFLTAPTQCMFTGQGGRPGGSTPCYPDPSRGQCNARWMTPIGLYFYGKIMEMGFIFDFDHMEYEMKTQALELAEAQDPAYPFVSTHGTFGGTSIDQAARSLRNGGFLYPSNGSSRGFRRDMDETLEVYELAFADVPESERPLFGFGFGTDTNGLSGQTGPRGDVGDKPVQYPYALFSGDGFDALPDFANIPGLDFNQPEARDETGAGRTWHQDIDGNANYGMLSGFVEEIRLEGTPEQLQHMFNSAEVFLQTWQRTLEASEAIGNNDNGGRVIVPDGVLRPAPVSEP